LKQDLREAGNCERCECDQSTWIYRSNDVSNYRKLRLGAQVHGIRVTQQDSHNTVIVAKGRIWLGAVQLIVTDGDD
jgi:hypothetical protein